MIQLNITVRIRDGHRMEFFQTLDSLVRLYRKENGCISYEYRFDEVEPNCCTIDAAWQSLQHLEKHFQNDNFAVLLGAMRLLCDQPNIEILDGKRKLGMEVIEAAQKKKTQKPGEGMGQ